MTILKTSPINYSKLTRSVLCAVLVSTGFTACAPLLLGGAMVGGSLIAIDRRTSGAQLEDKSIELKSTRRVSEVAGERSHVNVTSYNRLVLITGEAATEPEKTAIEQAVSRIENVQSVVNELAIALPTSIGNRSNDTLLTSKVKASLVDAPDLQSTVFKVVTERSIVYLMGRVTEREAGRAADIARGVSGVQKVVRVFEVVSEADLTKAIPKPVSPSASSAR
jgi:osmotically-inducible protein OsmY